jgi:hypothetical protein
VASMACAAAMPQEPRWPTTVLVVGLADVSHGH